ncbi:peptidylprolyl isomerase [Sulfobacillus harzensis]|nr:peptidylprolyl isomerase [Sulfobacillus harzensis]
MALNPHDSYQATLHTTAGTIVIQLFSQKDPVAVNNFVFLANHGFFNGNQFFRVIKSFVIQTGDPLNNGTGGPGYTWNAELPPPFPYQPGIVAMAVSESGPNTNGSQFFICTGSQSEELNSNPEYTELGRVVKGWSTVLKIASGAVTTNPVTNEDSYPVHPYTITSVTIQSTPSTGSTS